VRSSTLRALTGSALTAGLVLGATGTAMADSYEVEPGDTLTGIAERHDGVSSWQDLLEANSDAIADPAVIPVGQALTLPGGDAPEQAYEVEPGDTLAAIAAAHDEVPSWRALAAAKADEVPDPAVLPGQVLTLDVDAPATAPEAPAEADEPDEPDEPAEPEPAESTATDAGVWDRLAECEAGGNWSADTGNGYYGGLQFTLGSWEAVGGSGYPHEASREEQIQRGEALQAEQGWDAWPACSDELGLR
jgi:LysM repeat protein